jgi:regulation of enolase protein 1 (concanavalin A-like superfamily)
MKAAFYFIIAIISLVGVRCNQRNITADSKENTAIKSNMTQERVAEWHWMNQPQSYAVEDKSLKITVNEGTDFFNNPEDSSVVGSAPLLYQDVAGDFVAKALVQPDFSAQWNAMALMVYLDSLNWIKFAFENSDATGPGIVSVVTKGVSDDANGVILNEEVRVWLAIARKGNIYSMHWSVDGEDFKMARLTAMGNQKAVKIGIEAQSPVGDLATHQVHFFDLQQKAVTDLRNLNKQ